MGLFTIVVEGVDNIGYIIMLSALLITGAAIKYHTHALNKAKLKAYEDGYTMAFFTKETTPIFIRDSNGKKENSQAW